jgi:hypothetical protein
MIDLLKDGDWENSLLWELKGYSKQKDEASIQNDRNKAKPVLTLIADFRVVLVQLK